MNQQNTNNQQSQQSQQPEQDAQQQTAPAPQQEGHQMMPNDGPKKPDYLAYHVKYGGNGKTYSNKVGSAWNHRDGEGVEIKLDSIPVDGRISLRTLRENRMQDYQSQDQGKQQESVQQQNITQTHGIQR